MKESNSFKSKVDLIDVSFNTIGLYETFLLDNYDLTMEEKLELGVKRVKCLEDIGDFEAAESESVDILCQCLILLGQQELVDAYRNLKW